MNRSLCFHKSHPETSADPGSKMSARDGGSPPVGHHVALSQGSIKEAADARENAMEHPGPSALPRQEFHLFAAPSATDLNRHDHQPASP